MSRDPYGMKSIIKKVQRDSYVPVDYTRCDSRKRKTSFKDRLLGDMAETAERRGESLDFLVEEEESTPPPPPPKHKPTVLPAVGTRRVKHGIRPSSGVFGLVYDMQELDRDAFMLFYLEASREFEERTGDGGWTGQVMEHVLGFCGEEALKEKSGAEEEEGQEEGQEELEQEFSSSDEETASCEA